MPAPGARYRSEVRVEAGDAHSVRITIAPDGMPAWLIAEPLNRVTVSHEVQRDRPMLLLNSKENAGRAGARKSGVMILAGHEPMR